VLGRLGLPVAAIAVALALWSTTTWALASPTLPSPTIPAPATSTPATAGQLGGCSPAPLRAAAGNRQPCTVVTNGSALTLLARTSVSQQPLREVHRRR
jgi:hypothetical protein